MDNLLDIQAQIRDAQAKLAALEAKEVELMLQPAEFRIADYLHTITCRSNHIDQCSYEYDSWPKNGDLVSVGVNRRRYVHAAQKLLSATEDDEIKVMSMLDAIRGL